MRTLLHPAYLPNILTFGVIAQKKIVWEVQDNFQKQTFRNRTYICTDRGKLMLNIPIKHVGKNQGRQYYKDVKIDNSDHWQRQHWRTLQTAYRTSPFFEYYEDDIAPLYQQQYESLLEYNLSAIALICDCLQIEMPTVRTTSYNVDPTELQEARFLVNAKKEIQTDFPFYNQVFGERHGFLKNMSVLDLLFNEGTGALTYLKAINLDLLDA